jgi:hypothetical protein
VGDHEVEVGVEAGADPLEGRQVRRGRGHGLGQELVGGGAQPGDVQIALGREVVVEQPLRDPGRSRQVVDRDLVVGALGEGLATDLEELGAASVVVEADPPPWPRLGQRSRHRAGDAPSRGARETHASWVPRGRARPQPGAAPRARADDDHLLTAGQ